MKEFDYEQLLNLVDLKKGDFVDVASDLMAISFYCKKKHFKFDANELINCMQERISETGTIMIRTFNWDFCHGVSFDMAKTPSKVGKLGDIALIRDDFTRTRHPIYSWAVWGKYKEALCSLNNKTSFGQGTPFEFLYKNNGVQITIGNTASVGCTQIHHSEAMVNIPYRSEKDFTGSYIDLNGIESKRTYSMLVRPLNVDVSNEVLNEPKFTQILVEKGILSNKYYDGIINCRRYDLRQFTDYVVEDLTLRDGSLIVSINGVPGYKNSNVRWEELIY